MKLRNSLKKYRGRVVKIGSSTAYFYIALNEEGKTEETIDFINDEYNRKIRTAAFEARAMAKSSETRIRKKIEDAKKLVYDSGKVKNSKGGHVTLTPKNRAHYEALIALPEEQVQELIEEEETKYLDKANALEEYVDTMPRMLDREVIGSFDADPIFDGDARVILIEGIEKGRYWLKSEYENGTVDEEDDDE